MRIYVCVILYYYTAGWMPCQEKVKGRGIKRFYFFVKYGKMEK